jgi:pimeloyl-ACP methyl ester carboxylesterase
MDDATDLHFRAAGLRLAALAWGDDATPPALCLHGWLDNAESFRPLAEALEGARRVVALDLPGHGHSEHFGTGWSGHFVDVVPAVVRVIETLGDGGRVDLIGHSMGAGIAAVVAGSFPSLIQRLVLIEGFGPMADEADNAPTRLAKALAAERALKPSRTWPSFEAAVTARMKGLTELDLMAAHRLVERGAEAVPGGYRFRYDPRLRLPSRVRFTEDQVCAFLASITAPVLAIRATQGWPFPEEVVARRAAAIADLRVETVTGGHHVHLSHPQLVAPPVTSHLAGE